MNASKQFRIWGIGLLTFILLLYILSDVLTPFVAGMAVAYFVDPLADRLEEWGLSRLVATSVITVCFFILTIGVLSTLLPVLATQVIGFASRVPEYMDYVRNLAEPLIKDIFAGVSESDLKELGSTIASFAKQGLGVLGQVLKQVISGGVALVDIVSILVLTPLVTFYLLRDWDVMVARIDNWLPRKHADIIRDQFRLVDQTLAGFVRGQASVCLILGVFYAAGLSVLGLEFGLLVGLGAGLISFIPYFGSILGLGVSIAIALVQFDSWMDIAMVGGVFAIGQIIEGNFLTPKLVGEKVGLHPVWVIFALMAGGSLAGFTGVMLAVPVAAVIGVLVRFGLAQYMKSALYTGDMSK
ncbi:AI-2E family transporter [Terasakiella sp.]|uniref:AI-2E family transporter n=1 Tax=Terasakiella sp. TaxID=2034861 RepID=UPI003AA9643F